MAEETQDLWIIPGRNLEEYQLFDGKAEFFQKKIGQGNHHELLHECARKHHIDATNCHSVADFGKLFTNLGIALFINLGRIDTKLAAGIYLPSQLTEEQIHFFEQKQELFSQKFHENISLFGVSVMASEDIPYRNNGFRDLEIESIIEGKPSKNGQELLFKEIARQKNNLKGITK